MVGQSPLVCANGCSSGSWERARMSIPMEEPGVLAGDPRRGGSGLICADKYRGKKYFTIILIAPKQA